eukprot:TRINITY_DN6080_c0_g1_i1.p1 TRINITY_DN6080_c0_g1~~TRINITY_DN6080_c0_g1_i1.p1  ORF type:complete len:560 (-),score=211.45 TRINITY_DN6080_c0_g1_i1:7-1632(-)
MREAMDNLQEWTDQLRQKGASVLFSCFFYSPDRIPSIIDYRFLLQLSLVLSVEDQRSRQLVENSCLWMGYAVDPQYYLPLLLPMIRGKSPKLNGESSVSSSSDISRFTKLMNLLLRGYTRKNLNETAFSIVECYQQSLSQDSQMVDYREMIITCTFLLDHLDEEVMKNFIQPILQDFLFELLSLCRSQHSEESIQKTQLLINRVLQGSNASDMQQHIHQMMEKLIERTDSITQKNEFNSSEVKSLFFALETYNTILEHIEVSEFFLNISDRFCSSFERLLAPHLDLALKQRAMEILSSFTKRQMNLRKGLEERNDSLVWSELSVTLLDRLFKPFVVWLGGKPALLLRRIASNGAYQIIETMKYDSKTKEKIARYIFQHQSEKKNPLESVIVLWEDDDSSLRQIGIAMIYTLLDSFLSLHLQFSEENNKNIGEMMLKRMNDVDDSLRILNLDLVPIWFKLNPENLGQIRDSLLSQLVLHLDDLNEKVQEKIYQTITQLINESNQQSKSILKSNLEEAKKKHRNPSKYVDPLLALLHSLFKIT